MKLEFSSNRTLKITKSKTLNKPTSEFVIKNKKQIEKVIKYCKEQVIEDFDESLVSSDVQIIENTSNNIDVSMSIILNLIPTNGTIDVWDLNNLFVDGLNSTFNFFIEILESTDIKRLEIM